MTYEKARECFDENNTLIANPRENPLMWNLSAGLVALTQALQTDMLALQQQVRQLQIASQQQR